MVNIKRSKLKELAKANFGDDSLENQTKILVMISTSRCARVSYTVVGEEGKPDNYENDVKLHDRLLKSGHWSCFEHCAKSMSSEEYHRLHYKSDSENDKGWSGNFRGFVQYRQMLANDNK